MVTRILYTLPLLLLLLGCEQNTEEKLDYYTAKLPNNKVIKVTKHNTYTTTMGLITKTNYGTSHKFTYSFTVEGNEIRWDGGSAEPKSIVFCKDGVYNKHLINKKVVISELDSITNHTTTRTHFELRENYQKYVDERYFFKLFGDDYWITITPEEYLDKKEECKEYPIPNDNELNIKTDLTLTNN